MNRTNEKADFLSSTNKFRCSRGKRCGGGEPADACHGNFSQTAVTADGDLSDARLQIIADLGVPRSVASKKLSVNVDFDIDHLSEIISSNHGQQMLRQMASTP